MKKIIFPALMFLALASCKKDEGMSSKECQQKYNEIMNQYNSQLTTWTSRLQNGQVTHPSFVYNMNSAVDSANSQAQALTDCMGWQLLSKFN